MPHPAAGAVAILGLSLLAGLGAESARAAADLASCKASVARHDSDSAVADCYYELAKSHPADGGGATKALRSLLAHSPQSPWFILRLALLEENPAVDVERSYRAAAVLFAASGDIRGEVIARTNLARKLGEDERELETARAIATTTRSSDPVIEARRDFLEAQRLFPSGRELRRAYALLQHADSLLAANQDRLDRAVVQQSCLTLMGNVIAELGDFKKAGEAYRRSADVARSQGHARDEAADLYGVAHVAVEELAALPSVGARDRAIELMKRALEATKAARDPEDASNARAVLAELLPGAAGDGYLTDCRRVGLDDLHRSYCLSALARHFARSDPVKAREAAIQAQYEASSDPWAMVFAKESAMRVAWASGPRAEALAATKVALAAIEALRGKQGSSYEQAGLFSTWSDEYYWSAGSLLKATLGSDEGLLPLAFEIIERLRARTLLDALEKGHASQASEVDLAEEEKALEEEIKRVRGRAAGPPADEPAAAAKDHVVLLAKKVALEAKLAAADSPPEQPFARLADIRRRLGANEALLSFQIAPWTDWTGDFGGGSWLVVATRDASTRVYKLGEMGRQELRVEVAAYRAAALQDGAEVLESKLAADLYQKLLAPALKDLPPAAEHLIVIPDDALNGLPFAAMHRKGGPPLVQRFRFTSIPSATLWLHWRGERAPAAARPVLALASPPLPDPVARKKLADVELPAGGLPELPYASREAASAVYFLSGSRRVGREISESSLKHTDLLPFGILHFAAHSLVDEQAPGSSGIWLSPGSSSEDGLLRMSEIAALHLGPDQAVVLSTCDSAGGELVRGEGVLSLARAFFQAGAGAVVASLWPQRDDDAQRFFARFYLHLAEGQSLSAALAEAQRDRLHAGVPTRAWAGFVVLGDGDLVPVPGGRSWAFIHRRALEYAAAFAAALLLFWGAVTVARRR